MIIQISIVDTVMLLEMILAMFLNNTMQMICLQQPMKRHIGGQAINVVNIMIKEIHLVAVCIVNIIKTSDYSGVFIFL